ncbi:MAG: hypothetical protein ACRC33_28200 [Gemmataceae bacterium]
MRKWIALALALGSCGCMLNKYADDPAARMEQLTGEMDELKKVRDERQRFWSNDRPAAAKLAVANVRKEEALLFLVTESGLTFVRKLPHGEAADLDARPGQRYAAVFATAPHQAGHEVKAAGETWLLRRVAP